MTYSSLWREIYSKLGGEAHEFCRYVFNREPADVRSDTSSVPEELLEETENYLSRVLSNEPMQYVFGYAYFYGLDILCKENVLIPRSDTETVVEAAVKLIPERARFADVCCGSGCIAAAILNERRDLSAICIDINPDAVELTEKNLERYGFSERAEVILSDVFESWDKIGKFDVLVSNPPYIKAADMEKLPENVKREPYNALYGGEDGTDFYRRIISAAKDHFNGEIRIIFEIGYDEADAVRKTAEENALSCRIIKDLSGNDRCAVIGGI